MFIDLTTVRSQPRKIEHKFEPGDVDLTGEDVRLTSPVRVDAEIGSAGTKIKVAGNVKAGISLDCTRCLEAVEQELDIPFVVTFVGIEDDEQGAEVEVIVEDLDISPIEGGQLDLADIAREQILLALPIQNFCTAECKGLCSKCGANLNLTDCRCSDDEIDPRWAALKSLK